MKGYLITAVIVMLCSMFCGIIVMSIGMGSFFPVLNQVAGPVVCGNQTLQIDQHTRSYKPGSTNFSITAYCVDNQTGQKVDKTDSVQLVSGMMYSLLFFVLAIAAIVWSAFKWKDTGPSAGTASAEPVSDERPAAANRASSPDVDDKLRKLKELHDSKLITDEDYEKKKAKILDEI
jgi:hypothetical protein